MEIANYLSDIADSGYCKTKLNDFRLAEKKANDFANNNNIR